MVWQAEAPARERLAATAPGGWTEVGHDERRDERHDGSHDGRHDGPGSASARKRGAPVAVAERRRAPGRRLSDWLRDELLTVMSHDLMTPLMTLDGYVQLLREDAAAGDIAPADLVKGLTVIERQVVRLTEMAELVREYLRWEDRTQELVRAPTDLVALVARVVEALRPAAPHHRIDLALPPAPVVGMWDGRRLAQVVQNLLGNAIKYSLDGGTITVSIREGAGAAIVCVRDQGMGLPTNALPRLFERGYRVATAERDQTTSDDGNDGNDGDDGSDGSDGSNGYHSVTTHIKDDTRRPDGSGLGLYLCHRMIEAHGGRIWAESAGPGRGSTFWVSLPYGDVAGVHEGVDAVAQDWPA